MKHSKVVELVFFYASLTASAYVLYLLFAPYLVALMIAGMLTIVTFPLHEQVSGRFFGRSSTLAALFSTIISFTCIVVPFFLILMLLSRESLLLYDQLQNNETLSWKGIISLLQEYINIYIPNATISLSDSFRSLSGWGVAQLQVVFSSFLTLVMTLFISIMATFFFFRDGQKLVTWLMTVSPLPNEQDTVIMTRVYSAVRSVLSGIVFVSLIQGVVAGIGFWLFGVPKPVLWGTVAAFGGLLPGVGTPVIMIPAAIYLYVTGSTFAAGGILIWASISIIVIDNIIAPMLMSRGNPLHPLLVLLSILGGISLFGMIGMIIGPVTVSIFLVLLELQKKIIFDDPLTIAAAARKVVRKKTPK